MLFIVLVVYYLVYHHPPFCYLARLPLRFLRSRIALHFIKSLHVDYLISGADPLQEVESFYLKCKERLATANFNLRKFVSNSDSLDYPINNVTHEIIRLKFLDLRGT